MREWKRDGYKIEEREHDYDLHVFVVIVDGKKDQIITPDSIEAMSSIIADLDAGEEVQGWEDGTGNTIYTDPDLLIYDKDTFECMIEDWQADHTPDSGGIIIDEIVFEDNKWIAYAHYENDTYCLTDDGNLNIVINYLGSR